ncbi:MAG: endonuclease/exonuclease/phosphatase family protein [Pirellulaceae bacterium]
MLVLPSIALWLSIILLVALAGGSLLSLSRHPHWFIRGWDFPRVQIITLGIICLATYFTVRLLTDANVFGRSWQWPDTAVVLLGCGLIIWHLVQVINYTPLGRRQVLQTTSPDDERAIRLVVSNVEFENENYDLWLAVIGRAEADMVIAVEVDERWLRAIESLRAEFPFEIAQPQDNWYGMLVLSKLPLADIATRFLVEKDIPSIHMTVELRSGQRIRISAIHPRPPEPVRGNDSDHRDAELVVLAREMEDESLPTIVGGDLNDVAWSSTTRLFLRLSRLLDPRRGRGFFNTFHAKHFWLRFPLDHVFHSREFTLRKLERLAFVGSDHFPMLIELQYEPTEKAEQPPMELDEDHEEQAEEIVEREEDRGNKSLAQDQRAPLPGLRRFPGAIG